MAIKEILKELNIKMYEFAEELKITRPTLNNYIALYDNGDQIPKSKYQFVFRKLFEGEIADKEAFLEELDRIHMLLERDEHLGALDLDVETTDLMTSVIDNVRNDLSKDDYNEYVFKFINMLVTSYRSEKIFLDFINYFLYLNSVKSTNDIKDNEKAFLSNCFKLMHDDKEKKLEIDEEFFEAYINRIKEVKILSEKRGKEKAEYALKKRIKLEVNKKVKEQLALGLDVEEIDYDEIISNIDFTKNV